MDMELRLRQPSHSHVGINGAEKFKPPSSPFLSLSLVRLATSMDSISTTGNLPVVCNFFCVITIIIDAVFSAVL